MARDLKILQIVIDNKFTDAAIFQFESASKCSNEYWLFNDKANIKFVKSNKLRLIDLSCISVEWLKENVVGFDVVIFHSLSPVHIQVISKLSKKITTLWIGMGYDYYDLIESRSQNLFYKETKKLFQSPASSFINPINIYRHIRNALQERYTSKIVKPRLLKKINYFAPVLEVEYRIIEKKYRGKIAQYLDWNYGVVGNFIQKDIRINDSANHILIGNSGHPTNNHIEILMLLNAFNNDRKCILPVSYSAPPLYMKNLRLKIKSLKRDNVEFLTEFLSVQQYTEILKECGFVIMNHRRQQAGANISMMLAMGAKIFINEKNHFYAHFKSKGAFIFTIKDLIQDPSLLNHKLSYFEVEHNRELVKSLSATSVSLTKTQNLINCLLSEI